MISKFRFSIIILFVFGLVSLIQSCSSCSHERKHPTFNETPFEQSLTREDTVKVQQKIDQFFKYLIAKKYYDAADMIYHVDKTGKSLKPIELDNDEIQKFVTVWSSLPVESYRIEYMKFNQSISNETMCSVTLKKFAENAPAMHSKIFFKPIFYMGTWVLSLADTETGAPAIVNGDDRAKLSKKYQQYNNNLKKESENK